MNIIRVEYRFLRLSTNLLALVEVFPDSNVPQATTCIYPYKPYLTNSRELVESVYEQEFSFQKAVVEAKRKPILEFKCTEPEYREICLWVYRDPLVYWDEYCPLFDNQFNYVLR